MKIKIDKEIIIDFLNWFYAVKGGITSCTYNALKPIAEALHECLSSAEISNRRTRILNQGVPRNQCPGCFQVIYEVAAKTGWCKDCWPKRKEYLSQYDYPHKIMTPEEYQDLKIVGWHQVFKDYDGCGGVAIRYLPQIEDTNSFDTEEEKYSFYIPTRDLKYVAQAEKENILSVATNGEEKSYISPIYVIPPDARSSRGWIHAYDAFGKFLVEEVLQKYIIIRYKLDPPEDDSDVHRYHVEVKDVRILDPFWGLLHWGLKEE